ncbi:MAG: hypothetical protein OK457_03935 [Thaumarchaeota archaeon]|nr:hypothetical protein [Nitrososphaerota archaeon]
MPSPLYLAAPGWATCTGGGCPGPGRGQSQFLPPGPALGSVKVLNVVYTVTNDEDGGIYGYWALDSYVQHVQVWQQPDGTFFSTVAALGIFTTFAGAISPNSQTTTESKTASGIFLANYKSVFGATSFTSKTGFLGTFNFGGTVSDILLGTYGNGNGQTGDGAPVSVLPMFFSGISDFTNYASSWMYYCNGQTFSATSSGNSGNIVT